MIQKVLRVLVAVVVGLVLSCRQQPKLTMDQVPPAERGWAEGEGPQALNRWLSENPDSQIKTLVHVLTIHSLDGSDQVTGFDFQTEPTDKKRPHQTCAERSFQYEDVAFRDMVGADPNVVVNTDIRTVRGNSVFCYKY